MPSAQHKAKPIPARFDGEFLAGWHDDARCSDTVDVEGTIRALTVAMFAEVMKSARAALALREAA